MSNLTFTNKPTITDRKCEQDFSHVSRLISRKGWTSDLEPHIENEWDMMLMEVPEFSLKSKQIIRGYSHFSINNPLLIVKTSEGEFFVDTKLNLIVDAIQSSKELLNLKDDWDEEGAIGCNPLILDRATNLLLKYSQNVLKYHDVTVYAPEINLAKNGSIDLEWRCKNRILIINILNDEDLKAEYYGNDFKSKTIIKGTLENYGINRTLSFLDAKFSVMWETEKEIPNEDFLYVRIAESFVSRDKMPRATAFSNSPKTGPNLSSDWSKHCTPESSRELIGRQKKDGVPKNPVNFAIWQFSVGELREKVTPIQELKHEPFYNDPEIDGQPNNRAHSVIIGDKPNDPEFRALMVLAGEWAIPPK